MLKRIKAGSNYKMGGMKDLFLNEASNEEMSAMIDNARNQHDEGYILFLEEHLEKAEKRISKLTSKFREEERQRQAAIEYAEAVKKQNEELQSKLTG